MTKIFQGIIIGGSPSTGSSLLRQILNRHSRIVCAPETHIWCKEELYKDWESNKGKLLQRSIFGLASKGFFQFVGIDSSQVPKYNKAKTKQLIESSTDIGSFFKQFMAEFYELKADQLYGEKTPGNVLNFNYILESSEDKLCVHTVRDPYDTIASLVARGKSVMEATAFYLYNSAHAMNIWENDRLVTIRYEKLVEDPKLELQGVLGKLNLNFEEAMLQAGDKNQTEVTKLPSWKYDETEKVQQGSVGRFDALDTELKEEIILFVWHLCLKDQQRFSFTSIKDISQKLLYRIIEPKTSLNDAHTKELIKHRRSVTKIYKHPKIKHFSIRNYPLSLK